MFCTKYIASGVRATFVPHTYTATSGLTYIGLRSYKLKYMIGLSTQGINIIWNLVSTGCQGRTPWAKHTLLLQSNLLNSSAIYGLNDWIGGSFLRSLSRVSFWGSPCIDRGVLVSEWGFQEKKKKKRLSWGSTSVGTVTAWVCLVVLGVVFSRR